MESTPEKSGKQQKIRLLEVKNTSPQIDHKAVELKAKAELQQLIQEKMALIEETGKPHETKKTEGRTAEQEQILSKVNQIFANKNISNQDKIQEIYKVFLEQFLPRFEAAGRDMITGSSAKNFETAQEDELSTRADQMDNIVKRF